LDFRCIPVVFPRLNHKKCQYPVIISFRGGSSRMNTSNAHLARRQRFDQVVTVLYRDMYRYAAWLCRDPGIAEEVVQEALLRAWKSLDALREDSAAKQWLLTIVRRENARYFERKRLETVDIDDLTHAQAAMIAETDDSDLDDMREAIYKLDDDYREPLVLQVLLGHSTREIAELIGINPGAVLTRLHRARIKLKDIVEQDKQ
jgi:RNA polymerase sigma-70 factor, ECF subfamily